MTGGWGRTAGAICKPDLTPTLSDYTSGSTAFCSFHRTPYLCRTIVSWRKNSLRAIQLSDVSAHLISDCLASNPGSSPSWQGDHGQGTEPQFSISKGMMQYFLPHGINLKLLQKCPMHKNVQEAPDVVGHPLTVSL